MEEQEATISKQQKQIDALVSRVQKVSDQLELSKPAPQTVLTISKVRRVEQKSPFFRNLVSPFP
jgi:uncharacterized protein YhaN